MSDQKCAAIQKDIANGLSGVEVLERLRSGFYDNREWVVDGATFLMQPDGYDVSSKQEK